MSIVVTCTQCRQKFAAADWLAGQQVRCSACGNPLTVPSPGGSPDSQAPGGAPAAGGTSSSSDGGLVVRCGSCGQAFRADAALAGQRVPCGSCGQPISIPAASAPAAPRTVPRPAPVASADPLSDLGDVASYAAPAAPRGRPAGGYAPGTKTYAEPVVEVPAPPWIWWAVGSSIGLCVLVFLAIFVTSLFSGGGAPTAAPPAEATSSAPAAPNASVPPADQAKTPAP